MTGSYRTFRADWSGLRDAGLRDAGLRADWAACSPGYLATVPPRLWGGEEAGSRRAPATGRRQARNAIG
jgi:hypothetical protein